jgi:hypothetical protein
MQLGRALATNPDPAEVQETAPPYLNLLKGFELLDLSAELFGDLHNLPPSTTVPQSSSNEFSEDGEGNGDDFFNLNHILSAELQSLRRTSLTTDIPPKRADAGAAAKRGNPTNKASPSDITTPATDTPLDNVSDVATGAESEEPKPEKAKTKKHNAGTRTPNPDGPRNELLLWKAGVDETGQKLPGSGKNARNFAVVDPTPWNAEIAEEIEAYLQHYDVTEQVWEQVCAINLPPDYRRRAWWVDPPSGFPSLVYKASPHMYIWMMAARYVEGVAPEYKAH